MTVLEENLVIQVHCGVHGRVAVKLAEVVDSYNVELLITCDSQQVNCASILEVLGLAMTRGSQITVRVEGVLAKKALHVVKDLLTRDNDLI